jgi:phage tail sheath protein FI
MPEYLAPGVYVEEVSFRQKSIEGVSTSVAGFIGPTRFGPVGGTPELLTSFSDFTRIYGGIENLEFASGESINYMAHAVRAFFDNGGARLYVTRVYEPTAVTPPGAEPDPDAGNASLPLGSPTTATLRARFPGNAGDMRITIAVRPSVDILINANGVPALSGVRDKDVVYVVDGGSPPSGPASGLYQVVDGPTGRMLRGPAGNATSPPPDDVPVTDLQPGSHHAYRVSTTIAVRRVGRFEDEVLWDELSPTPGARRSIPDLFKATPASRADYLSIPFLIETDQTSGAEILRELVGDAVIDRLGNQPPARADDLQVMYRLAGGDDGRRPPAPAYVGEDDAETKTGLKTFEDIDEISIVAAPGATADYTNANQASADSVVQALVAHCQITMKYRVAVLEAPDNQILSEVRAFRGKFDSTHAALYYPWATVVDPLDPDGRREIQVSPAGVVSGIYARTDILHGVFKAPANEVAIGAIDFERILNKGEQDVLNPLGINCFRFFEGRGFRLWGARTISSDPEWKYISVRRYFAYLEHSIDRGTQWAVFENNSEPLWNNIRRTVEDFLINEWRNGALLGAKPEEAFFVRCDRSTMTQNDLDNGRLVCLIGVAVVKPAEFVIFRIGQMTAETKR